MMGTRLQVTLQHRPVRQSIVLLVLGLYLTVNIATLLHGRYGPQWDMQVDRQSIVTQVEPNGPADSAGIVPGDRLVSHPGASGPPALAYRSVLWVQHARETPHRVVIGRPYGTTFGAQALVGIGVLLLLIGGLAWAYGRGSHAPLLLYTLSLAVALTLLGDVWGNDGYSWAIRLSFVGGTVLFPLAWAALFLSFPAQRLGRMPWRALFGLLLCLAGGACVAYLLCLLLNTPYAFARYPGIGAFLLGMGLGLAALATGWQNYDERMRQQWRIIAWSAAGATFPVLLLSLIPEILCGSPVAPFELSALGLVILPLGFAYAIVRYNLMALDVVVRRAVAVMLGTFILVGLTGAITYPLHHWFPNLHLSWIVVAVLAGALGSTYTARWSRYLAERLLSPELLRSRHLLSSLFAPGYEGDLIDLTTRIENAAQGIANTSYARLLVRRPVPGAVFRAPHEGAASVAVPHLVSYMAHQPWGIGVGDASGPLCDEWRAIDRAAGMHPVVILPMYMRGDIIALLAVGETSTGEMPHGPDREALALLLAHMSLAVDYARVRADLEAETADAAALSAASARLAAALDDRSSLPRHIVEALSVLHDVEGASLLLYEPDGTPRIVAAYGATIPIPSPDNLTTPLFIASPVPAAWLPLMVGDDLIGALRVCWHADHVVRESDRRQLTIYANGAAMALEHARLYERARLEAERDAVTGLYNHRAFHTRLESAVDRAVTHGGTAGILLIDIADFKLFNDTYGHQAGDQALRRVGEILTSCCRTSDCAARLGGDEFAMLLPEADGEKTVATAARIADLAALSALVSPSGDRLPLRLSIGAAVFPHDAAAVSALLTCADERMLAAKRTGVTIVTTGASEEKDDDDQAAERFGLLEALVAMVDNRDRYTGEHSDQVATYACAIAAEFGFGSDTLRTLRLAGLLHDVGKIGVPDRILRKPGRLTDEEFAIIRRHVELSEVLLTVVTQDRDLLDAVRYHHERWDGRGYPHGMSGDAVPLLGRIMIVADAVSAMHMDRPYRKGLPWSQIAQELIRGAGAQFDPDLVPVALRALRPHIEHSDAA